MKEFLKALDRYWFSWGSPVPVGLYRICFGAIVLFDQLMLIPQYQDWFTETGFLPNRLALPWLGPQPTLGDQTLARVNLLQGVTDPFWVALVFILATVASLFVMLGLFTRFSTILLAVCLITVHHRSPTILHGGDTVIRVMLLYLCMAPAGAACSLDRLIGLWRGKIQPGPVYAPLWPQRLMAFNVSVLYLMTTWIKYGGNLWRDGTATWYTARLQEFERFPVPPFMKELPMVKVTTYGTLLVEFCLVSLVYYKPARKYVVIAAIGMHAYIEYSMNIPLFSMLMISSYLMFFEGEEITAWSRRMRPKLARFAKTIRLPGTLRPGPKEFFSAVDPFGLVKIESGAESVPAGAWRGAVGAWFFAWIPGLWRRLLDRGIVK